MKSYGIILSEKRIKVFLSPFYILKKHEIEKKKWKQPNVKSRYL